MPLPIIPIITAAASLGSAAVKARKAKQTEKQLEESLNGSPKYRPNQSILNYYDESLRKYKTSPTDTAEYKRDAQNIKQGTVQALSSLNKLRSGNVAGIVHGQNNALLNAVAKAENRKEREFSVLGNAANMKTGQEGKAFSQNELYPFEAKYNLLSTKAAGYRADQRQNTQNLFNNAMAVASGLAGDENGDGKGKDWLKGIFGNAGQRSEYRWNKGGKKWWQN